MNLVLTIFDRFQGPVSYINIPDKSIDESILEQIAAFMNLDLEDSFFELNLVNENLKTINYSFEIQSDWARGGTEMLQLTILTEKNYKNEIFLDWFKKTQQTIVSRDDIFIGCYKFMPDYINDPEVDVKYKELIEILSEMYKNLNETIESSIMGNILLLGINKVGKSTMIERLRKKVFSPNIKPTLSLTLIEQIIDSYHFKIIDVSGQKRLRDQWWSYTKKPDAIIYVFSVSDIIDKGDRLTESKEEFKTLLDRYSKEAKIPLSNKMPLLICINKIDITDDPEPIMDMMIEMLYLKNFKGNFRMQKTSAKTGEGIEDGFKWLVIQFLKI